ncbi:MAG TPA: hypothetical protein VK894_09670 [Jiangellales bacterium]|nr:hypothetical protein [Jiangellales bacterium]
MAWHWRYLDDSGATIDDESLPRRDFPNQADAESWVGEAWPELLDSGVNAVTLLEDERVVYGPMDLRPPD